MNIKNLTDEQHEKLYDELISVWDLSSGDEEWCVDAPDFKELCKIYPEVVEKYETLCSRVN